MAFSEIKVVKVPAPAINGKANGTIDEEERSDSSALKKWIPSTISKPIKNIINPPAIAKDPISIPKSFKMLSPRNKKSTINSPEAKVAFSD